MAANDIDLADTRRLVPRAPGRIMRSISGVRAMRQLPFAVALYVFAGAVAGAQDPPQKFTIPTLVKEMSPGVVHIAVLNGAGQTTGYGSGFVIDPGGTIVTAYHVIQGAPAAMVKTADGEIYDRIDVVQYDLRRDIAVLKIQPFRPLTALRLAGDDEVIVGEDAASIGNPQGLEATVSAGIISGYRQAEGYRLVQTTAPVSPGSSGGPLFNMAGAVVGMMTQAVDNTRGQNLNFAIPVVYIRTLLKSEAQASALGDFTKRVASSPLAALRPRPAAPNAIAGWTVLHAHRGFSDTCTGTLSLREGRLVFESPRGDGWDYPITRIVGIERGGGAGAPANAFQVRVVNAGDHRFIHIDDNRAHQDPESVINGIAAARRGQ